jgi:aminoglycoside phosphotransferase (APT) family kinase protein
MAHDVASIAGHFDLAGELDAIAPITAGHINDTYILKATAGGKTTRYVLQRINHYVFKEPVQVMANILRITEHIRSRVSRIDPELASRQLRVVPSDEAPGWYRDSSGNFWRLYNFIENAVTYDTPESPALAREAARMFGWFQSMLTDLPGSLLRETIPGFHDTPRRLRYFQRVLVEDKCHRARAAAAEIDFVLENAALCNVLPDLVARGELPVRIAHNDTKINNVMLDQDTGKGVCVIDLDTVMPGLSVHDFGDLVRTAACPAAEDERDLSQVAIDVPLFDALARGFAEETGQFLTPAEKSHMVFGGTLITFEQMIRFLTDYLAGDVYYKVHREGHNLDRTRTQMKLVQSIVEQEEVLNRLVERAFQESHKGMN